MGKRKTAKTGDKALYGSREKLANEANGGSRNKDDDDPMYDEVDRFHNDRDENFLRLEEEERGDSDDEDKHLAGNKHSVLDLGAGGTSSEDDDDSSSDDDAGRDNNRKAGEYSSSSEEEEDDVSSSDDDDDDDDDEGFRAMSGPRFRCEESEQYGRIKTNRTTPSIRSRMSPKRRRKKGHLTRFCECSYQSSSVSRYHCSVGSRSRSR
mmetsp:Transcript_19451/g.54213  ORF Transcript_19451/g.54213 Transcript_19451/m.54213 type:complete len:208 (-) Transcript_19451:673-1296(-)